MIARQVVSFALGFILAVGCGSGDDDDSTAQGGSSGTGTSGSSGSGGGAGKSSGGKGGSGAGGATSSAGEAAGGAASGQGGTGASTGVLCKRGCEATLAADCPNGPPSQAQCESDCQGLSSGSCADEYGTFQACADGEPVTCGSTGIPVVAACADEQAAFIACLNR